MDYKIYPEITDSHCHLMEMQEKGLPVDSILTELEEKSTSLLLDVAVHLDDFQERLEWKGYYQKLYFSAGIHPNIPKDEWQNGYQDILKQQIAHPLVKAVGESGLDFYRSHSSEPEQKELLNIQYELAGNAEKPLIFHIRDAEDAMMEWIHERDFPMGAVLHCFSGNVNLCQLALEKGFFISYAGPVSFKNADALRKTLHMIPLEKLLVETDAPYLCPHPKRGKLNHPGFISYTYDAIAEELALPQKDLIQQVKTNLHRFLNIPL